MCYANHIKSHKIVEISFLFMLGVQKFIKVFLLKNCEHSISYLL